jgi:hypothetical protein
MSQYYEFGLKYPYLVYDIWDFYCNNKISGIHSDIIKRKGINTDVFQPKCTLDFLNSFSNIYKELNSDVPIQPWTIAKICDKLCDHRYLQKFETAGFNNIDKVTNFYYGNINKKGDREILSNIFNSVVFGFQYIYDYNKNNVLPIYVKKGSNQFIGTCFKTIHGIITAKHCIANCDSIKIGNIDKMLLNNSIILSKDDLDLVVIQLKSEYDWKKCLFTEKGFVLDEIMVMGYPSHCGFNNFVTATKGSIAAIERSYLAKYNLMLLTSKVKGGNSGGPVINIEGKVVGIVTESSISEGENYDQFGYGLAMPQEYIEEVIKSGQKYNGDIIFE